MLIEVQILLFSDDTRKQRVVGNRRQKAFDVIYAGEDIDTAGIFAHRFVEP